MNDNLLVQPSDYTPYSITAPSIHGCPAAAATRSPASTTSSRPSPGRSAISSTTRTKYGDWYQYFNGVDITLNVRTAGGLTFQGGTSTGQTVADNCDVRANLPELNAGIGAGLVGSTVSPTSPVLSRRLRRADAAPGSCAPIRSRRVDVQVSGVFQSKPGALLSANYAVPSRRRRAIARTAAVGERDQRDGQPDRARLLYGDRLNQLDFRVAKILRFGGTRTMVGLDLYNALNRSADPDLQQHLRPERNVAAAEDGADGAAGPHQRGVQLLTWVAETSAHRGDTADDGHEG